MTDEEKQYYLVRYCNDTKETVEKAELDRVYKSGRPVFEVIPLEQEKTS